MPDKDTTLMSPLFGEGEDWEYGTTVDEDFAKKLEKQDPEVRFNEAVNTVAESRIFPDNLLIINDVFLYGVPIAAIRVEKPTDVFVGETLRTASPILYSEGRQNPALYLTLLFKYDMEQLRQLHRIVSVLRRHPFTYIHHNKIAREIGTKEFESTIFALESGTLRSASDTVDVIILDLSFKLFNYKPFTNHHWYSGYLFSENTPKTSTNESDVEQNPLDMKGYSADQFSISTTTEEQRSSAAKRTLNNSILGDAPVVLPSESPAWMMYADRLSSPDLTPPIISDVPSDYIGFSVKEFEYISPPGSARAGKGDIGFWYNTDNSDLRPHIYPWRKTDGPIPTVQEEYAEAAVTFEDTPIAIDANSLATYKVRNTNKSVQIDSNTALWLGRMVVGEGGGKASDQKVSALIWAILNRWAFYYKNKSLIEAIRVFSQPVNPRWLPGGDLYAKWKGTKYTSEKRIARRQLITTLSWNSIPKRIRSLINRFRQGTLGSPEVFKSIRKSRITNWGSVKDLVWTKRLQTIGDQYIDISGDRFFQDAGIRGGSIEIITPKNPQGELAVPNDLDLNAAQRKVQEKQAALNNAKDNSSDKRRATDNLVKATTQAREAWINYQANANNKYYYNEDPNLRNIFYTSRETHISGDFRQQLNLKVAPNITCSAISISFGHRLAQMKLVGQSTSTFQFLGAGNRTGQLVFTYSGDDGETAAKELKDIIDIARKNAQYFSQQIPEAGSVKISSYNPYSGEQNIILALLGIEDIIITNIEDSTSPNSPDTSQLVVEFIVQEFGRESYERKFVDSVDIRKSIIKGILEYVIYAKDPKSDFRKFIPHFSIATYNPGAGREYQVKPGIPSWFAGLVAKASEICTNTNDEAPPTNWRRGTNSSETWRSAYEEYGAGNLIAGRTKNTSTFGYGVTYAQNLATVALNTVFGNGENLTANEVGEDPTLDEFIESNSLLQGGGQQTNDIHVDVFRKWLAQMTALATEAQQYIRDEENFKYYFGSIGTDILNTVTANLNACYDDMDLPNIPGTELRLPPEFYIYDDSGEDPMLSEATNRENMELFLKKHVDNEIASITHYMENAWLGGSYVSKNLPRILETRQAREQFVNAELLYFSTWFNLIVDGGQPWEPIKHRYADPSIEPSASINSWFGFMQDQMGAKTEDEMRLKYMDNLIRLSSYLKDGRHWGGSYESENRSTQSIVESIYGDAWNKVAFGPNPMYANADSAIAGLAEPESTLNARRIIEEQQVAESLKGNPNATKEISDLRTIRGDGAVTVGNLKEEEESAPLAGTIFEGLKEFVGVLSPVAVGIVDAVEYGINAADRVLSTFQNIIAMKHPLINKIKQDESSKNIAKLATSVALGNKKNDLSMRRAYPTFRVYFIEDDSEDTELYGKTIVRAFDDFYSYSAIQEIRIYRSRKIASDTAIIRMTNVTGKLMRRKFGDRDQTLQELEREERQGIFADTKEEHPFEKMVLQDGVKVQIRLGNASNPDDLETAFLGQIVEIAPAENGKILEIMMQGFGAELEAVELGPFEDGPVFFSAQQILSGAIIQDSIINFGRKSKFNRFNPAEMRHAWTGGSGSNAIASVSPARLLESWSNSGMEQALSQNTFLNYPQDDNIFAPSPEIYATAWERFWNNACSYRPLNQTAWQIFKEHELRHPGYCALAVPYGHSPRMTMFFGAKSQHYWSRPPTPFELYMSENNYNAMIKLRYMGINSSKDMLAVGQKFKELEAASPALAQALLADLISTSAPNNVLTELGKQFGRYVPFRNYHYFDDKHHIIKNEIKTSVDGTFNEVTILYFENENSLDDDNEELTKNIQSMVTEDDGVFSVKLDENIPDQYLRSYKEAFPSCVTTEMARRYASGLLARHLKDAYKGELVVLGKANIKPYDICFLNDSSIDMTGPIEVEAVVQIISRDTGFVSVITPDLCVDVNDMYSASVFDVAAAGSAMVWGGTGLGGSLTGLSTLGLMAGVKIASWTQDGDPIIATPLTFGGRPFVSATLGANDTSMITQLYGKWRQYWDDLDDAWEKLDITEALFDTKIGIQESIFNTIGTGFSGGVRPAGE